MIKLRTSKRNGLIALMIGLIVLIVGLWIFMSQAAGYFVSVNPTDTTLSGNAKLVTEADGTKVLQFTAPVVQPPVPPPGTGAQSCPAYPAFPNADCTGVPAGTPLTVVNGDVVLSTPGMVYDAKDVRGTIYVRASNITIKRTKVSGGTFYQAIVQQNGAKGLLVEDTEVGPTSGTGGDEAIAFSDYTCRRCDLRGFSDGTKVNGNVLIEDSYVHDLYRKADDHNDGLQNHGGEGNVTIRHSHIDVRPINNRNEGYTAILVADNATGTMTIENNLLIGGQFTLHLADVAKYVVRGNHFVKGTNTVSILRTDERSQNNVIWENNVYHDTGLVANK